MAQLSGTARYVRTNILPFWRTFVIFLAPLLPLGLLISHYDDPAARCAWGVIIMSIYWMTEAVPLVITGMLPVLLFPVLGLIDTDTVSKLYLNKSNMLRMTGLMVAVAIENVNLHKRIALRILLLTGTSPRRIMLGFMLATVLISMWISNAAASAMMVPIVQAVLEEIYEKKENVPDVSILPRVADGLFSHHHDFRKEAQDLEEEVAELGTVQLEVIKSNCCNDVEVEKPTEGVLNPAGMKEDLKKKYHTARIGNMLAVCFAANLGGTGVVTGCAPNLILLGILDSLYESTQLNFATWMLFNIPPMLVNTFFGWLWLQAWFFDLKLDDIIRLFKKSHNVSQETEKRWQEEKAAEQRAEEVIRRRYEALGGIRFDEGMTSLLFAILVATWIFRAPRFVRGWSELFERDVSEATPCVLIIFLMFVIPRDPSIPFLRKPSEEGKALEPSKSLLNWQIIHEKLPWNVVILMGGAVGMAEVCKTSGLTAVVGAKFATINFFSPGVLLLLMTTLTAFLTELASNAATASIILPILNSMAKEMNIHPLYLMLPATITTSYSFMLPVANPPNAITYTAAGNMKVSDMAKAGFLMNIIGIAVLNIATNTYGRLIFDFTSFPTPVGGLDIVPVQFSATEAVSEAAVEMAATSTLALGL